MISDGALRPRAIIVVGYFDWFSGYQETALAAALCKLADTEVVASDRVSPIFSNEHLKRLGVSRRYAPGTAIEHGVKVTRFRTIEIRSMVWSFRVPRYLAHRSCDLVVQVMPGQLLSAAASLTLNPAPRVVLYGDNKAMWSHLPRWQRLGKAALFAITKGLLYLLVNVRARNGYGYTPNTLRRLHPFGAGRLNSVMPLVFSPEQFFLDTHLRRQYREGLGLNETSILLVAPGKMLLQKRLDWLISAFHTIAAEQTDVHLLLVGADSSNYSLTICEAVRKSPFRERIYALPFTDSAGLNEVFNAADLGIWPRNPAITIQQAMGTGLSVLLPRNDLVGHLIRPGSGCYFDLDEADGEKSLYEGLDHALRNSDFSEKGRRDRVVTNRWLSADIVARTLLDTVRGRT